jgi:D-glycero-alpha-D-manno-heptose-7-phosphate kinase
VRLDFAGGWTDVAPFCTDEGGAVVNAAIDLHVAAVVSPGGDCYRLEATDLGERLETVSIASDGQLSLHKAALRRSGLGPCRLRTTSNTPAGSGLGSSGALGVALVAATDAARQVERSAAEIAEEAWQVEAVDARLAGGRQDQYAAALGGFHHFRFTADGVEVEPVVLDDAFTSMLAELMIICYTGASRISSRMISRVMQGYAAKDPDITRALRGLASLAGPMAAALRASDPDEVGRLLAENWRFQMALDPGMRTAEMARLEDAMHQVGSMGGKAAGAGAGGCMFFLCHDPEAARKAAREAGARVIPCAWASEGVRTWRE